MHSQPDRLLPQLATIEPGAIDSNFTRGIAYGLVFVMPLWLLIGASVLAL